MKAILLCLVVASVFAKPKGYIELADAAKDVAQKETDKAVEEARLAHVRQNDDCVKNCGEDCRKNHLDDNKRRFACYQGCPDWC